jgi:hypothetical protein
MLHYQHQQPFGEAKPSQIIATVQKDQKWKNKFSGWTNQSRSSINSYPAPWKATISMCHRRRHTIASKREFKSLQPRRFYANWLHFVSSNRSKSKRQRGNGIRFAFGSHRLQCFVWCKVNYDLAAKRL